LSTKFASFWHHQLNNISHLFILVQSFPYTQTFECAKITRWSHRKSVTLQ